MGSAACRTTNPISHKCVKQGVTELHYRPATCLGVTLVMLLPSYPRWTTPRGRKSFLAFREYCRGLLQLPGSVYTSAAGVGCFCGHAFLTPPMKGEIAW